jgi:nucleoside-triphosphatase THEP1
MKPIEELEDTWEVTSPIAMREKVNEVINAVNALIDTVNRRRCAPWLDRKEESL